MEDTDAEFRLRENNLRHARREVLQLRGKGRHPCFVRFESCAKVVRVTGEFAGEDVRADEAEGRSGAREGRAAVRGITDHPDAARGGGEILGADLARVFEVDFRAGGEALKGTLGDDAVGGGGMKEVLSDGGDLRGLREFLVPLGFGAAPVGGCQVYSRGGNCGRTYHMRKADVRPGPPGRKLSARLPGRWVTTQWSSSWSSGLQGYMK